MSELLVEQLPFVPKWEPSHPEWNEVREKQLWNGILHDIATLMYDGVISVQEWEKIYISLPVSLREEYKIQNATDTRDTIIRELLLRWMFDSEDLLLLILLSPGEWIAMLIGHNKIKDSLTPANLLLSLAKLFVGNVVWLVLTGIKQVYDAYYPEIIKITPEEAKIYVQLPENWYQIWFQDIPKELKNPVSSSIFTGIFMRYYTAICETKSPEFCKKALDNFLATFPAEVGLAREVVRSQLGV